MKLVIDGSIEGIKTRQDGSVVFTLATQEMDAENVGKLFQFRSKYVKCLLSDTNVTNLEEELIDSEQIVNGKKREVATIRFFADGGRLKACIHDRETGQTWWTTLDAKADPCVELEASLIAQQGEWRKDKPR